MNYPLITDAIYLVRDFEAQNKGRHYPADSNGFRQWIADNTPSAGKSSPTWEGKSRGRSAESVINTLIVHMNRYARNYSRSAIDGSEFSTQDDFIFLINLRVFGPMTKMELIKKNVHDKPGGMLIINRLIKQGWVEQSVSDDDRRSKIIRITSSGEQVLDARMDKIREASRIVTGNLSDAEKTELIRLLQKLESYHRPVYEQNVQPGALLDYVTHEYEPPTHE